MKTKAFAALLIRGINGERKRGINEGYVEYIIKCEFVEKLAVRLF